MRSTAVLRSIIAVVVGSLILGGSALAQTVAPPDGITVIGQGRAIAPADHTTFQISLSSQSYGAPVSRPILQATPGTQERTQVRPVVDALVGAGVPEEDITVVVPPFLANVQSGPFGPTAAYFTFTMDGVTSDTIEAIVTAATVGAAQSGLLVGSVNLLHTVEDCTALQEEARSAAFGDAQRQAAQQAEIVGVTLDDVTAVRDNPTFALPMLLGADPEGAAPGSCSYSAAMDISYGPYGPTPYDIASDPEVVVVSMVDVTFGIEPGTATPAA